MYLGFWSDVSMLIPITPINSKGAIPVYWLKCICRCQTRVLLSLKYQIYLFDIENLMRFFHLILIVNSVIVFRMLLRVSLLDLIVPVQTQYVELKENFLERTTFLL